MVQIQISSGQGITQAIKAKIQADGGTIANNNLSVWTQVMNEVKTTQANGEASSTINVQNKDYAYTGGDDTSKLNNSSNWQTDFKVFAGQVIELAQDVWNRIVNLLTGQTPEPETPADGENGDPEVAPENKTAPETYSNL